MGLDGVALLRLHGAFRGGEAPQRITGIRDTVANLDDLRLAASRDDPELEIIDGYRLWSATYDRLGNLLIGMEEPVVRELLNQLAPGHVLDAACGTGRHLAYLAGQGRLVTVSTSRARCSLSPRRKSRKLACVGETWYRSR